LLEMISSGAKTVGRLARLPIRSVDLTYTAGTPPFEGDITYQRGIYQYAATIHRVGLKNRMWMTVKEVRIQVARLEPDPIGHLPLPLRVMHQNVPPPPLNLPRSREPTDYADVLGVPKSADLEQYLVLFHALPDQQVQPLIPRQDYRLQLRVTSLDSRPTERWFSVSVGGAGHVGFMPED
jgi:hypothetical protein